MAKVFSVSDYKKELGSLNDVELIQVASMVDDIAHGFLVHVKKNVQLTPSQEERMMKYYEQVVDASNKGVDQIIARNRKKADVQRG
jgi:hypothetical protein